MKKAEKTEITRERILAAALLEFGENGYDGASLNNICMTGISKGLLYHNFESKDALYIACLKRCYDKFTEFLNNNNAGESLYHCLKLRLSFFTENTILAKLFFEAMLTPPKKLSEKIVPIKSSFDLLNRDIFMYAISDLTLREGVTKVSALEYFTFVQNAFNGHFVTTISENAPFEDVVAAHEKGLMQLVDFLLHGIAAPKL